MHPWLQPGRHLEGQLGLFGHLDVAGVGEFIAVARPTLIAELSGKVEGARYGAAARLADSANYAGVAAGAQAGFDALVPAAAIRLLGADPAADIEPILGTGHGDIEQAVLLLECAIARRGAPGPRRLVGVVGARQPQPGLAVGAGQQAL